ncbi:hypothetical protein Landi51_13611 [Colletotrichum acutatum]
MPPSPNVSVQRASCPISNLSGQQGGQAKVPSCVEVQGVKARGSNGTVNVWSFFLRQLPTRSPVRRPTTPSKLIVLFFSSSSVPTLLKIAVVAASRRIHTDNHDPIYVNFDSRDDNIADCETKADADTKGTARPPPKSHSPPPSTTALGLQAPACA